MSNAKVSVIIPVYKVEKFIRKCVDSVLNQTYNNLEVILVDDGSPDNCPLICDDYVKRDTRVRVFHKTNGGQSSARNLALDNMTGDYVSFVDSDDYIEPDMIETMLSCIEREEGDVAICLEKRDDEKNYEGDIYENILEDKIGSQVWRYLFKASKFYGRRFPVGRFAEDIAILDKVLYNSKIIYVPERFYNYYFDNQGNSSNAPQNKYKNTVDRAIAFSGRYEWLKDKADISADTKQVVLSKAVSFCLSTFCRYKNNTYNANDISYLYCFLNENKVQIKGLKQLGSIKKIAVRFLVACPKTFSFIGSRIIRR